jgi:hypothetical protein
MSAKTPIKCELDVDGQGVKITLANGEELRVIPQDSMGVEGYQVKIFASKQLVVLPSSGNAVVLTTPKAARQLEDEIQRVVATRDSQYGRSPFDRRGRA